jgi:hypothetical protein
MRSWLVLLMISCGGVPAAWAQSPIYRCKVDGVTVFADQPCASDAQSVTLDSKWVSSYEPVPVAKVASPKRARTAKRRAANSAPAKNSAPANDKQARCTRLRTSLRDIEDKLRSGYTAKQGIRLEERRRTLRQQARDLHC